MDSYANFSFVYDKLINQDYTEIADKIENIFKKYNVAPKLVLDLACGTGSLTVELAKRGYDMIGVDLSEEMLCVAYNKAFDYPQIRFLCQDMTDFELYGTVDCVVCTLDAVNYITDIRKLKRMFRLVNNYLNPDGLFIFDINTIYKLKHILGNNSFIYDENDVFYTWENFFNPRNNISRQLLTFFEKSDNDKYTRFEELHTQRGYTHAEIKVFLKECGLHFCEIMNWNDGKTVRKNAEKTIFVSKKIC